MSAVEQEGRSDEMQLENDDEAAVSILTYGDPIRSFSRLLTPIGDEFRVEFDADGIHTQMVDPANVAMLDLTAHAEGFERFDIRESVTFGLNIGRFRDAVSWARKRGDGDPVAIDIFENPARIRVRITRPDQQMTRVTEWFGFDPASIREAPNHPDISLSHRATPGVKPLHEAVKAVATNHDHAHVTCDAETFVIASQQGGDTRPEPGEDGAEDAVMMPNCAWDTRSDADAEPTSSVFSIAYLEDIATAINQAKTDRVTVNWGDEFPVEFHIENEDWGFEGQYLVAPRIQSED